MDILKENKPIMGGRTADVILNRVHQPPYRLSKSEKSIEDFKEELADIKTLVVENNCMLDSIIHLLKPKEVKDNWRSWASVMEGCSYNGGTLEADYTEQGMWRIKMVQGDFTQPMYIPSHIDATTIDVWWAENQDTFMKNAQESIDAYKAIL